jgi:hypothetical protein
MAQKSWQEIRFGAEYSALLIFQKSFKKGLTNARLCAIIKTMKER